MPILDTSHMAQQSFQGIAMFWVYYEALVAFLCGVLNFKYKLSK